MSGVITMCALLGCEWSRHQRQIGKQMAAPAEAIAAAPLIFEDHFRRVGGTIGFGTFGDVSACEVSTPAGAEFVRARGFGANPRLVAKAIKAPSAADAARRAGREKHAVNLERERAALATWRHPGLVSFIGEFRLANGAEPSTCFVLEACEGMKTDGPRNQGADWVKLGASRGEFLAIPEKSRPRRTD